MIAVTQVNLKQQVRPMKMFTPPGSLMVTGEVSVPEAYPGLAFIDGLRQKMRVEGGGVAVVPRRVRISGLQPRAMPEALDLLGENV